MTPLSLQDIFSKKCLKKRSIYKQPLRKEISHFRSSKIASHKSSSLQPIVENLMVESDNLTAELLVKTIGNQTTGLQGNWKNGLHAMRLFLKDEVGMDTTGFSISDGSGVSRYNYSSASHFIELLSWIYNTSNIRDIYLRTLSYTGENGTLLDRNLPDGIYAKQAHYLEYQHFLVILFIHRKINRFSILMNGYKGSSFSFRAVQDRIVSQIASFCNETSSFNILCIFLAFASCGSEENKSPYVIALGIAQDGEFLKLDTKRQSCKDRWMKSKKEIYVTSLGIVDPNTKEAWIIEASPDFKFQHKKAFD